MFKISYQMIYKLCGAIFFSDSDLLKIPLLLEEILNDNSALGTALLVHAFYEKLFGLP